MILVIGCGYAGLPLALRLKEEGETVLGWVGSEEGASTARSAGLSNLVIGDVGQTQAWSGQVGGQLANISTIVLCASSNRGGPDAYTNVFLRGSEQAFTFCPQASFILVSSTSVYAQTRGEEVTEDSATEPTTETGKILHAAEQLVLNNGGVVARSAGIYGPGRAVSFEKFLNGSAILEGDGSKYMNQIHRDDLVGALCLLIRRGFRGSIYNICDDIPVSAADFYQWCAEVTGKPFPATGPENKNRKRGVTNKRVNNQKLRELGWQPVYRSFREGLMASYPDEVKI